VSTRQSYDEFVENQQKTITIGVAARSYLVAARRFANDGVPADFRPEFGTSGAAVAVGAPATAYDKIGCWNVNRPLISTPPKLFPRLARIYLGHRICQCPAARDVAPGRVFQERVAQYQ
jgi:hypothetical protein